MNEAALLAACEVAPDDPVPRLILADCLEDWGTPGRAAVARLVRRSAKALDAGPPAALSVLTREKNRLSKSRPSAVAWFEWWFGMNVSTIVSLSSALDRRRLAQFVVQCVRETPTCSGRVVDLLPGTAWKVMDLLTRYATGSDLRRGDWQAEELRDYSSSLGSLRTDVTILEAFVPLPTCGPGDFLEALALADTDVPPSLARWAAVSSATRCEQVSAAEGCDRALARALHRRLLHECVPCPFDPEGDG